MTIEFNLTGSDRKELAHAVSEIIGASAEYQYMPTCAYKIGDFFTVTRKATLTSVTEPTARKSKI